MDGAIRLAGSSSPLEGHVEVCYDGVWGTVCSNLWGLADAKVVCRQLGYSSSGKLKRLHEWGVGRVASYNDKGDTQGTEVKSPFLKLICGH